MEHLKVFLGNKLDYHVRTHKACVKRVLENPTNHNTNRLIRYHNRIKAVKCIIDDIDKGIFDLNYRLRIADEKLEALFDSYDEETLAADKKDELVERQELLFLLREIRANFPTQDSY